MEEVESVSLAESGILLKGLTNGTQISFCTTKETIKKIFLKRSSHCGSAVMNLTNIHENVGLIPGLTQCGEDLALSCELWHSWQTWLESWVAVVVV